MLDKTKANFIMFVCLIVGLSACGGAAPAESEIATAVALTVQAQNALTEVSELPSPTFDEFINPTGTLDITPSNTPSGAAANPGCVASADLVSENPPDDVLLTPGEYFWKTWTFKNTGTCIWNPNYNLVYWDGDLMGGLVSYSFSEIVNPGETMDISIYLLTPASEGSFKGYWRFETSWGEYFGVGPQSSSFYVSVSTSNKPRYGIANVTYNLVREPATGCPLNTRYHLYVTVTSDGPVTFSYYWDQSDGNESYEQSIRLKHAESITLKRTWQISKNDSPNPRWIKFVITKPEYRDYGKEPILHDCFKN